MKRFHILKTMPKEVQDFVTANNNHDEYDDWDEVELLEAILELEKEKEDGKQNITD